YPGSARKPVPPACAGCHRCGFAPQPARRWHALRAALPGGTLRNGNPASPESSSSGCASYGEQVPSHPETSVFLTLFQRNSIIELESPMSRKPPVEDIPSDTNRTMTFLQGAPALRHTGSAGGRAQELLALPQEKVVGHPGNVITDHPMYRLPFC